ncbi:MAG: class I SAM-dependent methyltransferase [Candidatus Hydrogenedentes bacterium]|nr:class I SAM-dependent methyltransferase [Candidatus Hydrogenedentota bacterium]
MNLLEAIHSRYILGRRVARLAELLADVLPEEGACLDVGCGDGCIDRLIMERRPALTITGVEALVRHETAIPVQAYDGATLPYEAGQFDVVLFVDVLHHVDDPVALMAEACRVARRSLVIKDHLLEGWFAGPTLRLMDSVGNRRFGIGLPFHFWPQAKWEEAWRELHLTVRTWIPELRLYPPHLSPFFDRKLHFIAALEKERP